MPTPEQSAERFFHDRPLELSLYRAFEETVRSRIPTVIKVRGRPEHYIVVSFAADRRIDHPRIVSVAEPYPHRWTHHVLVTSPEDIDAKLMDWVEQAWRLTNKK